jgi:uncharacterized protein (DUF885 family)
MNAPATAREALVAEAIGDAARLLDRIEQLLPALEGARVALTNADAALVLRIEALEKRMASIITTTTTETVEHLALQARLMAVRSVEGQRVAMAGVARRLFGEEIEPALARLTATLDRQAARLTGPARQWPGYLATALVSSMATWAVALAVMPP